MVIVKVLKRKDASSLIVAVVLAMMVSTFLVQITMEGSEELSKLISGNDNIFGTDGSVAGLGWEVAYLLPTVTILLQVIALELLIRLFIFLRGMWISSH